MPEKNKKQIKRYFIVFCLEIMKHLGVMKKHKNPNPRAHLLPCIFWSSYQEKFENIHIRLEFGDDLHTLKKKSL